MFTGCLLIKYLEPGEHDYRWTEKKGRMTTSSPSSICDMMRACALSGSFSKTYLLLGNMHKQLRSSAIYWPADSVSLVLGDLGSEEA